MSYIKREDALDAVLFALAGTGQQSKAIYAVKDVPTADVVPAKRGSWIVTDADDGMCEDYAGFIEFKCSECGCGFGFENGQYDWYYGDPITWKACPMCGADMSAKMDGERKEE